MRKMVVKFYRLTFVQNVTRASYCNFRKQNKLRIIQLNWRKRKLTIESISIRLNPFKCMNSHLCMWAPIEKYSVWMRFGRFAANSRCYRYTLLFKWFHEDDVICSEFLKKCPNIESLSCVAFEYRAIKKKKKKIIREICWWRRSQRRKYSLPFRESRWCHSHWCGFEWRTGCVSFQLFRRSRW